jgi:hypothetical protein
MQSAVRAAIAILTITFAAVPVAGDTPQQSPIVSRLISASLPKSQFAKSQDRSALVQAVVDYCSEVGKVYPRNSPAEDEWLNAELLAGGSRTERALASAELGRRKAANFVTECHGFTSAYHSGRRTFGMVGLAQAFNKFHIDAEFMAKKNRVNPDGVGLGLLTVALDGLLSAALYEAAATP